MTNRDLYLFMLFKTLIDFKLYMRSKLAMREFTSVHFEKSGNGIGRIKQMLTSTD